MKRKIKEIILLIVFIVVVSFIAISIKEMLNKDETSDLTEASDIAKTIDTNVNDLNDNNKRDVVISDTQTIDEKITVPSGVFAVIDIPSVGIRGKVVEGTDDETLKNYIGMFKGCNLPGEYGNFSVAAHNNIYTEIFRNLYKVKAGEKVRVITKDYEYIYMVKTITEIMPTQTEVLEADYNKKEITLLTCTDLGRSRICVKGELVSQNEIK